MSEIVRNINCAFDRGWDAADNREPENSNPYRVRYMRNAWFAGYKQYNRRAREIRSQIYSDGAPTHD